MRKLKLLPLLLLLAACVPRPAPGPPPPTAEVVRIIHVVFDPIGQGDKAVRIANCESHLNPLNGYPNAYYKGLFQLGPNYAATINANGGNWWDAYTNSIAARASFQQRGNWSAFPTCQYA